MTNWRDFGMLLLLTISARVISYLVVRWIEKFKPRSYLHFIVSADPEMNLYRSRRQDTSLPSKQKKFSLKFVTELIGLMTALVALAMALVNCFVIHPK